MLEGLTTVTARNALTGEKRLYKYRSMADEVQKSRLKDILFEHRIRFSRPSELNDPIEGKPIFQLGDWSSPAYRQTFEDWAWKTQQHVNPRPPKDKFLSWIRDKSQEFHAEKVRMINAANHAGIDQKWRVLSLSADPTHDLMWSHYADSHRGVALVFDASGGEFGLAFKVHYVPERIPVDITTQDWTTILNATLLTKRATWAYEQEFRCIASEPAEPITPKLQAQFMTFPPERLQGIIFGGKASQTDVSEILTLISSRTVPLQVWRAKIAENGGINVVK